MLRDRKWKLKYTPDDGDLVRLFYEPALERRRALRPPDGLLQRRRPCPRRARYRRAGRATRGRMRLIVGCTLDAARDRGHRAGGGVSARGIEQRLADVPLAPPDADASGALELLAWMVARGHLDVKVAVPCDANGTPVNNDGIFHEKAGIIEDRTGEKIAWNGSLNETAAGWRTNWESINVYTGWGLQPERVVAEETNFARIWANRDTASGPCSTFRTRCGATCCVSCRRTVSCPARLKGVVEGKPEVTPDVPAPGPPAVNPRRLAKPGVGVHPAGADPPRRR